MRRVVVPLILVAVAIALFFVLRHRKQQLIAAQIQLLQSNDFGPATQARKRLQRIGRSAVRPVCALLTHKSEEVRARAALTLANIGHPAACGPLMAAAKRGDFPAADALEFMKHRRAAEARANAYCRLADRKLAELRAGLPVGGRPLLVPLVGRYGRYTGLWRRPPFAPQASSWPQGRGYADWYWTVSEPNRADTWYDWAQQYYPLPEAAIGRARLRELCGDYGGASGFYERALRLAPGSQTARGGKARTRRLATLAGDMQRLLPEGGTIEHILTHPTWARHDGTYYLGLAGRHRTTLDLGSVAPRLVLFKREEGRLRVVHVIDIFSAGELAQARSAYWQQTYAYAGLVAGEEGHGAPAVGVMGATGWWPPQGRLPRRRDVALYRLVNGALVRIVHLPSASMPWVVDVDGDGDAEIITWRWVTLDHAGSGPWPLVHALVDGRYEVRTAQFPSVFEGVPSVLEDAEQSDPLDPKLPDYAGRAHEMLGRTAEAIEAYRRAERKYLARAGYVEKRGKAHQARLHRQAAAIVRDRRLRLETPQSDKSPP